MEKDNTIQKVVTLCFVLFGFLGFIVARVLFESLAVTFGSVGKLWAETSYQHGIPVSIGLITFFVLQFTPSTKLWGEEVVGEIKKMVFPSRKDTTAMTVVTIIMLLVSGVVLGTFDFLATKVVGAILTL